jgi:hypothetical protein
MRMSSFQVLDMRGRENSTIVPVHTSAKSSRSTITITITVPIPLLRDTPLYGTLRRTIRISTPGG